MSNRYNHHLVTREAQEATQTKADSRRRPTAAGFFFARGVNLGRAAAVWWCFGSLPLAPDDDCSGLTQAKKKAKGFPNYNFYIVETHIYSLARGPSSASSGWRHGTHPLDSSRTRLFLPSIGFQRFHPGKILLAQSYTGKRHTSKVTIFRYSSSTIPRLLIRNRRNPANSWNLQVLLWFLEFEVFSGFASVSY